MRSWMVGLVAGILPVGLLPQLPAPWVAVCLALVATLPLRFHTRWAHFAGGVTAGCFVALLSGYQLLAARLPATCEGLPIILVGEVASLPRTTRMRSGESRQRFEFTVEEVQPSHCAGPRRALLSLYGGPGLGPGERWQFPVRLKRPWGLSNPGSYNMQAWYSRTGIDAVGTVRSGPAIQLQGEEGLGAMHHRLRRKVADRLLSLPLDPAVRGMLQAVTVADRSGLDYSLWSLLQYFGVNHLLVISGLHIGMLAGLGYLMGGLLSRLLWIGGCQRGSSHVPAIAALTLSLAYAALAGFSLSTVRALCMLACFLVAGSLGRTSNSWNNLLMAAVLLLLFNPLAALGSGFWLSFGAVACLLWVLGLRPGAGPFFRIVGIHLYMSLAMLPMGAWWFGGASQFSAAANLLMIPLVGLFIVPVSLLATLCSLLDLPLDANLWRLAAWPLSQLLPPARGLVDSHDKLLYLHMSAQLPMVLLGLLAVLLLVIRGQYRLRLLALCLLLPLLLPRLDDRGKSDPVLQVVVLDVGQGTSVLMRHGDQALLYDTGGGDPAGSNLATSVVLPYLRQAGIRSLDTLLVSHPDADHSAGVTSVLNAMPVGRVLYSSGSPPRIGARQCRAGMAWRWPGGVRFQLLAPAGETDLTSNDGSCVLRVQYAGHSLLLPGDIEANRERELVSYWGETLRSDWLLAAHHGSRTSSSYVWLKSVQPGVVVFSHGYINRFGHPDPEVVRRFQQAQTRLLGTAARGALEFSFLPGRVEVRSHRENHRRYWM